jgi:hypothetical protein
LPQPLLEKFENQNRLPGMVGMIARQKRAGASRFWANGASVSSACRLACCTTLFRHDAPQGGNGCLFMKFQKFSNLGAVRALPRYGDACFVYLPKLLLSELLSELFLAAAVEDMM